MHDNTYFGASRLKINPTLGYLERQGPDEPREHQSTACFAKQGILKHRLFTCSQITIPEDGGPKQSFVPVLFHPLGGRKGPSTRHSQFLPKTISPVDCGGRNLKYGYCC